MKLLFTFVAVCALFCLGSGQSTPSADEVLAKVNEVIDVPGLKDLNMSLITKPFGEVENALRKKCEKNGSPQAYDAAKDAGKQVYHCAKNLVNITQLKDEMDKARPTGDLDEVFNKYCRKKPVLYNCLHSFTDAIEPCLDPQEKDNKKILQNITHNILDFICFKEGDRIALFVAEKGPECFQSRAQDIANCSTLIYESYSGKSGLPTFDPAAGLSGIPEIKDIPRLIFDRKTCQNIETFQTCVVQALEKCDGSTPANFVDSIFNYVKKAIACKKLLA